MSNKTIEARQANIEKGSATAYDYVLGKYGKQGAEEYKQRVDKMLEDGKISKTKQKKLLMREQDIPKDFIKRDLRNSQYIACKACEILESMVRTVEPTTGSVTDRLREDWQLVDVMKELNWDKYDRLGLNEEYTEFLGNKVTCHSIPIRPGRNLAIIVESAAVNHRQKKMGYNAAQELYRRVQENMSKKRKEEDE